MNTTKRSQMIAVSCAIVGSLFLINELRAQPIISYARQGFSMRLSYDNRGVSGRQAIPLGSADSVGLEYPIGSPYEHIFGAGPWIGGKLDTAQTGTSTPIALVSTAYEGWAGPLNEFFPGNSPSDSIWKVLGRGVPRPAGWETYWGNLIPGHSFSDNDFYALYTDERISPPVQGHYPLHLKVAQNGFVWSDPYAEAIQIMEYRLINMGVKPIDSVYFGFFLEGDVGPIHVPNYWTHNCSGYYGSVHTAYIHNPVDIGSTPVGVGVIHTPLPLDSLRFSFQHWPGSSHPPTDAAKYSLLSSGVIAPDEFPSLSDTRCLLSFGPFTFHPVGSPLHDTTVVAICIVSGQSLSELELHAARARIIYENGGVVDVQGNGHPLPGRFELSQNYPNPFNPSTTIRFTLSTGSLVRLSVLNILGEEVAVLVDRPLQIGEHSVVWDASTAPTGVYFYRIQTDQFVETRKMILLR